MMATTDARTRLREGEREIDRSSRTPWGVPEEVSTSLLVLALGGPEVGPSQKPAPLDFIFHVVFVFQFNQSSTSIAFTNCAHTSRAKRRGHLREDVAHRTVTTNVLLARKVVSS